jgi:hypothetical protein
MSDDSSWPFSFVNICDALGLHAAHLRAALARWESSFHSLTPPALRKFRIRQPTGDRTRVGGTPPLPRGRRRASAMWV